MAMPESEQELFDSAMSAEAPVQVVRLEEQEAKPEKVEANTQTDNRERDDKGRFASTKVEEEKPVTKQETAQEQPKVEKTEDRSERGEIPAWRLREEAEAKREWQSKAEQSARDVEETRRQLAALQQQVSGFQRQQAEAKTPPPDRYADPDGYDAYQAQQYQMGLRQQAVSFSEQLARVKFGDELYSKAEQELERHVNVNPHDPIVHVIRNSSQPAFEVVKWFQQQEANKRLAGKSIDDLLKEHGEKLLDDPAYLARAIEKAKATAKPVQTQANATIPSLNRTTGAGSDTGAEDESDAALFKSAMTR
jgi:hypothetical protein